MQLYKIKNIADFEHYYQMKCQEDAILWSGFSSPPERERLFKHFCNHILTNNTRTYYYFLKDEDNVIGFIQGTEIDNITVECGATHIVKRFQGLGYKQDMDSLFIEEMKNIGYRLIIGWVSEKNKTSEYSCRMNQFTKTSEYEERNMPLLGGLHRFYKWTKEI